MGVAAATDDPVHPLEVGLEWVAAAPRAALRTVTLDEIGSRPGGAGRGVCRRAVRRLATAIGARFRALSGCARLRAEIAIRR